MPLTPDERAWLKDVKADRDYEIVRQARHPLTHALLVRTAYIRMQPPTGHAERSAFELVGGQPVAGRPQARDLILKAYSVADSARRSISTLTGLLPLRVSVYRPCRSWAYQSVLIRFELRVPR